MTSGSPAAEGGRDGNGFLEVKWCKMVSSPKITPCLDDPRRGLGATFRGHLRGVMVVLGRKQRRVFSGEMLREAATEVGTVYRVTRPPPVGMPCSARCHE